MDLVVVGERIRRERERAGLNQRQLARLAELSQPTLARIENGQRAGLTLAELDRLAVAMDIPVRLLTSGSPVRERVQVAARMNDLVASEREEAIRHTLEVLELDARLDKAGIGLRQHRRPDLKAPLPSEELPREEQARQLARWVREELVLGWAPVSDVDELIEQFTGVDTAVLPLPRSRDGFTITDPARETTLVAVRACNVPERQRFSFAHELGHLLWQDGTMVHELVDGRTPGEKRCDAFARHMLAPEEGIRAWLEGQRSEAESSRGTKIDERAAALLARHFRVSFMVILIQLENMSLITRDLKEKLRGPTGEELAQRYGWGPAYEQEQEAAEAVRAPRRILERAVEAYRRNLIGVRALAVLEGRKPEEAEERLREAGIVPNPPSPKHADLSRLIARGRAKGE